MCVIADEFGMKETMKNILRRHRLRWLGHMTRMQDHRLPEQLLFGEMQRTRTTHGPKKRWRDLVAADISSLNIDRNLYDVAQNRSEWIRVCERRVIAENDDLCIASTINDPTSTPVHADGSFADKEI